MPKRGGSKGRKKLDLNTVSRLQLHRLPQEITQAFFEELAGSSDRAAALLATASIDQQLEAVLIGKFVPISPTEIEAQFHGKNANFGTFSIKIDLAYLLGLIDQETKADLDTLRRIRNAFAHSTFPLNFEFDVVREHIEKLSTVEGALSPGAAKIAFIDAALSVNMKLFRVLSEHADELLAVANLIVKGAGAPATSPAKSDE